MLQNPCKTLGFKKNMVYKIPPGGGGGKPYPASGLYSLCPASPTGRPNPGLRIKVYSLLIFNFNQNKSCGYSKERDGSFEHPKPMFK